MTPSRSFEGTRAVRTTIDSVLDLNLPRFEMTRSDLPQATAAIRASDHSATEESCCRNRDNSWNAKDCRESRPAIPGNRWKTPPQPEGSDLRSQCEDRPRLRRSHKSLAKRRSINDLVSHPTPGDRRTPRYRNGSKRVFVTFVSLCSNSSFESLTTQTTAGILR